MKEYFRFLAVLMFFAVGLSAGADETFPTLEADGHIYTNVIITAVTAADIYFTCNGGMGNVKIKTLPPELKKYFNYNASAAAAEEKQQARADAQYQSFVAGQWGTDLPAALKRARSENKHVLMFFTGSDWCPWCMMLDEDVFSTPRFTDYAQKKLVLVKVDFPLKPQNDAIRQANHALAKRFNVAGYPACILLDASGKELGRIVSYPEGDPDAFISELDSIGGIAWPGWKWYLLAAAPVGLVLLHMAARKISELSTPRRREFVKTVAVKPRVGSTITIKI